MSLFNIKHWLQKETGVSCNIPITHLPTPDIFETQDGQFGAVLKIKGIAYLTVDAERLKYYQQIIHQAILQLDSRFIVMETVHRRYESTTLSNNTFTHHFCQQLHDKYHQQFNQGLYVNDIYLTVLYKGHVSTASKKGVLNRILNISNQLMDKTIINARSIARNQAIKCLNQKMSDWQARLSVFGVTRLGEEKEGFNALIAFLSLVPNGGKSISIAYTTYYPVHATDLHHMAKTQVAYPQGHLGQHLTNYRLFFGDAIQFQGNNVNDCRFAAMLTIKNYYKTTSFANFDALLALDSEFIRTQTFAPLVLEEALQTIKMAHSKKISAEDEAVSQLEELGTLADWTAGGALSLGIHHHSLMIVSPNKEHLESAINDATTAYAKAFIAVVRESLAQPLSFFAQIPGNARFITRASPISSENFADFCSLHNTQSGSREHCLLGEPITLVQTPEKTPVFWNYHLPGNLNDPSSGHTLIIGGNGSGKTALACFLDAEMNRFKGHRTFFLDRNQGAKIYIHACDGTYLTLHPKLQQEYAMNPLQLPDTEENRAFCKRWMNALLLEEGESSSDSSITEMIDEVVNYGFDHLAPLDRNLSAIASLLSIDFPRWPQLRRWLKESNLRKAGEYGWAFDNALDALNFNADKTGIDLTYLMDHVPSHIATPFYMYLLHRIKLSLTGQITSIIIDEMWQVMKDPFWEHELEHYLPTIRKLFGHIIGMTQSPETVVQSRINHVLLDNNASLVLFANPKAKREIYKDALKLSEAEFKLIVSNATKSRLVLYKQEHESIFCHLDFSLIKQELPVLSSNVNSNKRVDELRMQKGTTAQAWLPVFLEQCP